MVASKRLSWTVKLKLIQAFSAFTAVNNVV